MYLTILHVTVNNNLFKFFLSYQSRNHNLSSWLVVWKILILNSSIFLVGLGVNWTNIEHKLLFRYTYWKKHLHSLYCCRLIFTNSLEKNLTYKGYKYFIFTRFIWENTANNNPLCCFPLHSLSTCSMVWPRWNKPIWLLD